MTWLCRLTAGATFVFSGFVKAVDPWGTLYKFEEYLAALGIPMLHTLLVAGVFGLCALEFMIGVFLVLGCYRRSAPVVALAFMALMLPLTLWIAVSDPVKDCGCFGDALILSNWETFWKNIVLTLICIWLVKFNTRAVTLISPAFQWLAVVVSIAFIGCVSCYGYLCQPLLDFRPYPVGGAVADASESSGGQYMFVYEREGLRREFGEDDELPSEDDGWTFVERRRVSDSKDTTDSGRTFRIWTEDGESDVTEEVITSADSSLMLLVPELTSVSPATTWKINSLYDWSERMGIEMFAVVSAVPEQIEAWKDLSMPRYEIYTGDDTAIKEVVRGNPALVYVKNGKIMWKSTLAAVDTDRITVSDNPEAIMMPAIDGIGKMTHWSLTYMAVLGVLVAFSMIPRLRNLFCRLIARPKHDDTAHPAELSGHDKAAQ